MFNAIKNLINNISLSLHKNENGITFQVIGKLLIVHVPRTRLPPAKNEQYMKAILGEMSKIKDDFGVDTVYVVNKGE